MPNNDSSDTNVEQHIWTEGKLAFGVACWYPFVMDSVSLVPGVLGVDPFPPFAIIPSLFTTDIPFATDAMQS